MNAKDLRHRDSTPPVTRTASSGRDLVCRSGVAGDGAGPSPSSPADTAFYPNHGVQELHAEMVRLGAVMQNRGVVA